MAVKCTTKNIKTKKRLHQLHFKRSKCYGVTTHGTGYLTYPILFLKMQKQRQKIVLFIEPKEKRLNKSFQTPTKIGNLFLNRSAIDEDESNEILKIIELEITLSYIIRNVQYEVLDGGLDLFDHQ